LTIAFLTGTIKLPMDISTSTITAIITLLISISATYNAYLLRGGKLAWSQVLIALGMISFMLSLIFEIFMPDSRLVQNTVVTDALLVLGFVFLLLATLKLRSALR
jgi:ABC-type spermidine/putrescine transport system permease subunit I